MWTSRFGAERRLGARPMDIESPPSRGAAGPTHGLLQAAAMLVIGLGVGWLVGLSLSPVVGTVIAALLGVIGGIVTGSRSVAGEGGIGNIDAQPAAVLVLGIAVAATAGLAARAHGVFEPAGQTGRAAAAATSVPTASMHIGLYAIPLEECAELRAAWGRRQPESFVRQFEASSITGAKELARRIGEPETLRLVVEAVCTPR